MKSLDTTPCDVGFRQFAAECQADAEGSQRHGQLYLSVCIDRLYATFRLCAGYVPPGARVLSAGAGGAYVEKQLQRHCGAEVTVLDFPEAVAAHAGDYARHQFHAVGVDLATAWRLEGPPSFDLALSLEVMEHLPVAPHDHVQALARYVRPGGHLLVSTPNLARLSNVVRLLAGRRILEDARLVFRPTAYAQEHVHRREYMAAEIVAAFDAAGLVPRRIVYGLFLGRHRRRPVARLWRLAACLHPPLGNTLLLVAQKPW